MVRTPCCSKTGLKRGPWTSEEDDLLVHYISSHGEGGWRTLPKKAGLRRCGKSCRLRWMNYLRPDVKRGQITPDEEDIILRMHRLLGNRWSLIAGRIPGRTDNEIKNYWNTHLSKKLITQGIDPRTHKPLSNTSKITTKEKQDLQSHDGERDGDAHKGHEVLMVFDSQDSHEKSHSGSDDEDDDDDEEDDDHESLKNGGVGSSQSINPETNITKNGGVAITGDIHGYNNMEENLVGDTTNNELEEAYHSDIMSFFLECFMDEPEDNVERSRQHQNMLGLQQHSHTSQVSKSDYDAMWSSAPPESPSLV